ncbi:hypothetical protein [Thioalkalivibrio thiocyanodenitrificans]|uniref:hypothetical protein n=1 Tax=Thioalkalivibrio thiocyanodenitrificans TaxID=243063 RepID=UPI0003654D9F|nr:hypothetical protein [Thioalkalivibrio thiocyanodenitrificans]
MDSVNKSLFLLSRQDPVTASREESYLLAGAYLDDTQFTRRNPAKADAMSNYLREQIFADLTNGYSEQVHKICQRSWALGELLEEVLVAMEPMFED